MAIPVDDGVLERVRKCQRCFKCQTGAHDTLCPVEEMIGSDILFVNPKENTVCPYRLAFGYSYLCLCPARKEIYKKHKQ
jgi:hypothetical protein